MNDVFFLSNRVWLVGVGDKCHQPWTLVIGQSGKRILLSCAETRRLTVRLSRMSVRSKDFI